MTTKQTQTQKKILALVDGIIRELTQEELKNLLKRNPDVFKFESKT
jgi:hypothetical protein